MVENRPGHEDAQPKGDERDQPASEATPDNTDRTPDDAIEAQAAAPADPELPPAEPPEPPTAEPEPPVEASIERPETRFADEPSPRAAPSEPHRPGIAAVMLPPILAVAIAAAVVVGAAKTGLLPQFLSSTSVSEPARDDAAIEALKARIAELEARPSAGAKPVADAAALDALAARIASLEARPAPDATAAAAAADPALAGKVEALEQTVATLRDDLTALRSRADQLAGTVKDMKAGGSEPAAATPDTPADRPAGEAGPNAAAVAAINARLAELEQAAKASAAFPKSSAAASTDDAPLRRLVTATMLDLTVKQGAPYGAVLQAAQPLAVDPAALKPLQPFADTGVPSAAALGRELIALLPKLLVADDAGTNPNFIDRFQANAERLVRIQRSDATPGPDRTAIVGRLTAAAQRGDLAEARRELKALAPADRAPVQSWIDKSEARDQALAASQSFASAALAALSKPSP
ncbi:hypothetical protein LPW26_22940 [Rhodopseudomonas sp. HC1]|uniref:COG4223 family protein n=1 Tax=Rhodopseudomonas infernalis TaxID=2897386 RepID=UPI001EE7AF51|nr:hypothetical protein [Rhodopseudomonas infernalis]MCG6207513.1 hypothetical protein [Rhodopseudomonas infernalis]